MDNRSLLRSASFDPDLLQRAPSHISIRQIRRQNTDTALLSTSQSLLGDYITETDGTCTKTTTGGSTDQTESSRTPQGGSADQMECSGTSQGGSTNQIDPTLSLSDEFLILTMSQHQEFLASTTVSNSKSCIECVKAIPVFSGEEIQVGDHIVFAGAVYDHHGIVVGKKQENQRNLFEIIEATNTISGVVVGFSKFLGEKAKIGKSMKEFDFEKDNIRIVEYKYRKYDRNKTVQNAQMYLDGDLKFEYHLFDNNCEHFATKCVTGKKYSVQVRKIGMTVKLFLSSGLLGISDEQKRNEKELENKILCERCYDMNKFLLNVESHPIKCRSDVAAGDVIRYSYWNLWHDAVVLDIHDGGKNYITCEIAHYAFCGFFSHRTIKKEELKINFNGSISKLAYDPPKYESYDPHVVVERAKSRIGEQLFVFFSNDSSHFARWCKLKLLKCAKETSL